MHPRCSEFLGLGKTQGFRHALPSFEEALSIGLHSSGSPVCQCHLGARSLWFLSTQHGQHGRPSIPKKFRSSKRLGSRPCRMLASAKRLLHFAISELSKFKCPFYRSRHSIRKKLEHHGHFYARHRSHAASKFTNFGQMAKPRQVQQHFRIKLANQARQHPRLGWPLTCRILGIHRFKH